MGRYTKTPILVQSKKEFIQKVQLERKVNKMETQFSPQIFVIPQKMLQQQQKQSLLKIATTTPTLAPAAPKYRVILSDSNKTNKILVNDKIQIAKSKPMAAVVGCKRPAEPEPCLCPSIKSEEDEDDEICGTPMRKRANLDHLSPEERLQRRKLKNRVAAQNARDKKKAQTEEMEKLIEDMRAEKQKFAEENARLQACKAQLQIENASLLKENKEYKQKLGIISQNQTESQEIHIELPMSPDSLPPMSPSSSSPSSPVSVSSLASPRSSPMVPPESAALTNEPQPQEQGTMTPLIITSPRTGLSSQDLTPWVQSCVVTMSCLLTTLMMILKQSSPKQPSLSLSQQRHQHPLPPPPPLSPITKLPLKKRSWACSSQHPPRI